jgi:hypothetical protein
MGQRRIQILLELASGRWQPEGLTEGWGAAPSTTTLCVAVSLPEASSGRI